MTHTHRSDPNQNDGRPWAARGAVGRGHGSGLLPKHCEHGKRRQDVTTSPCTSLCSIAGLEDCVFFKVVLKYPALHTPAHRTVALSRRAKAAIALARS